MGAHVTLMEADFDHVLPFSDGRFSAAVSRLALMTASDPVVTLRELRRVTAAGRRIVTRTVAFHMQCEKWGATRNASTLHPKPPARVVATSKSSDPSISSTRHTIWTLLHVWTDLRFHQQG